MTKKPTLLKGLKIHELTICERPANQHSFATIFKSDEPLVETITKRCIDVNDGAVAFSTALAEDAERSKKWKAREGLWPIFEAFQTSVNSTITDTELSPEDRLARIQMGAFEMVGAIRDKFPDVEAELNKLFVETVKQENPMTEAEKAQLAELQKNYETTQAQLAVANELLKMSDEERKYLDGMKDDEQKEKFRKLDPEARKKLLAANKSADEVFKSADGVEIRKSEVGDGLYAILKSQNDQITAQATEIKKANERAELVTLEKTAGETLGHLPGTNIEKAQVLKSIADLPEDVKKTLDAMLKAGDAAMKSAFKMSGVKTDIEKTAEGELDAEIKKAQAADPKLDYAQAMDKVLAEKPELYDATQPQLN